MKPSHVSRELRRIASKIDGSTNPSSKLVANDLKRVLAAMGGVGQGQGQGQGYDDDTVTAKVFNGSDSMRANKQFGQYSKMELANMFSDDDQMWIEMRGGVSGETYYVSGTSEFNGRGVVVVFQDIKSEPGDPVNWGPGSVYGAIDYVLSH